MPLPISSYKRKLVSSLVNSPQLIELLNSDYVIDGECEEADSLIYKQIFPYYYIPEKQEEEKAYVILKVNAPYRVDKMYKKVTVYVMVISHRNIMEVKNAGGTRIDLMGESIESIFDGRDDFGFGEMVMTSTNEVHINDSYEAREMVFTVDEFNQDACKQDGQANNSN